MPKDGRLRPEAENCVPTALRIGELRSFLVDTYRGTWPVSVANHEGRTVVSMKEASVQIVCSEIDDVLAVELLLPHRKKDLRMQATESELWRASSIQEGRLLFDVRTDDDLEHLEDALLSALGPDVSRCR